MAAMHIASRRCVEAAHDHFAEEVALRQKNPREQPTSTFFVRNSHGSTMYLRSSAPHIIIIIAAAGAAGTYLTDLALSITPPGV